MRAPTLQMGRHLNSIDRIDSRLRRDGFARDWYGGGPPTEPSSIAHAAHGSRRGARRLVLYTRYARFDGTGLSREVHQVTVDLHTLTWRVAADCQEVARGVGYTHLVKQVHRLRRRAKGAEAMAPAEIGERAARQDGVRAMRERDDWIAWLAEYGLDKFYDAFLRTAQDAQGHCVRCGQAIYLDIAEGGGVPDWRTSDGDYGCGAVPEPGGGSHQPRKLLGRP